MGEGFEKGNERIKRRTYVLNRRINNISSVKRRIPLFSKRFGFFILSLPVIKKQLRERQNMKKEEIQLRAVRCSEEDMVKIVEALRPLILSSIRKYYNKRHLYDELFQEGCVEIIEGLLDYDAEKGIPFIAYIKKRLYYYYLGKNHNKEELSLDKENEEGDSLISLLQSDVDIEKDLLNKEEYRELQIAVSRLPERQRNIIIDFYFRKMKIKDIGEKYGISYRSCVNSKTKGLHNLRKHYKNKFEKEHMF